MPKVFCLYAVGLIIALQTQNPTVGKNTVGSKQPTTPLEGIQTQTKADRRGTEQSPLIVHEDSTPRNKDEADRGLHKESVEAAEKRAEFNLTVFLAVTGLLQAIVLGLQWLLLRRQTQIMKEHAIELKNVANAALLNATAVIKSERPWITGSVGDGSFKLFGNPALIPNFTLAIKNSGRTPGRLVRVLMKFEKRGSLDDFHGLERDLSVVDICPVPYVLIVPEDRTFQVSGTIEGGQPIGRSEMEEIKGGKKFLIAYGLIEYEDVFDTVDKSHKSGFFFYYAFGGPISHGFQTYYSAPSDYLQVT